MFFERPCFFLKIATEVSEKIHMISVEACYRGTRFAICCWLSLVSKRLQESSLRTLSHIVCLSHEMLKYVNMEVHNLKLYDTLQIRFLLYDFLE